MEKYLYIMQSTMVVVTILIWLAFSQVIIAIKYDDDDNDDDDDDDDILF